MKKNKIMSLPKEPRQKMINMMYLVLTALLALNVSSEILNAFKTVNTSLEKTNTVVGNSTSTIMKSLDEKRNEAGSQIKAQEWYPKAQQAAGYTKTIFDYIQSLKEKITSQAGGDLGKNIPIKKEDNLDIATRLMVEQGEGKKLLQMLTDYKKNLLAIDPLIGKEFATTLPINLEKPVTKNKGNNTWEAAYFRMVPTVAAITMLSKFQNDVKTSENRVVAYCHEQVGKVVVKFDTYAAVVGQSSNYLMPGQKLDITAGIGAFSKQALPQISIGGSTVAIGEDGAAHWSTTVGGSGGSIPVVIRYKDQDGNDKEERRTVEYMVGQSNTSIALDKMNVLYIGVNNPVTIAASAGSEKVNATISQGSIQKVGPGKYVARVNSVTDNCTINVIVDGKTVGQANFRVRTIPKPVATVGGASSGDNIPAGTFRAQGGVAAWVKDFPFDLKYTVTQFTFSTDSDDGDILETTCTGNAFSPRAQEIIRNQVKSGKTVYIDNIRAVGEDGANVKVPSLVYYIK
jgi:gliding motility-associated protein GldM